jgi:hypothetical protein
MADGFDGGEQSFSDHDLQFGHHRFEYRPIVNDFDRDRKIWKPWERFHLRDLEGVASFPAPHWTLSGPPWRECAENPMYSRFMRMEPLDVNLHLHGFEGPPSQEDVFLSTLSTPAHACEYDITIPRTQPPGTYFYHPHAHGMTRPEVGGGLSGMWIVEPDGSQLSEVDQHELGDATRFRYNKLS